MPQPIPYIVGPHIQNKEMFFGRAEEVAQLQDALQVGNHKALIGLRRIGKSSLLYHICHHTDLPRPANGQITLVPVYMDLHNPDLRSIAGFGQFILKEVSRRTNEPLPSVTNVVELNTVLEGLNDKKYRPLLCLDEVEKMMEHLCFSADFFENLRYLGANSKVTFLTSSLHPLEEVVQHGGKTSPFFNIFTRLEIKGLDDAAARDLLTKPFSRAARVPPPTQHLDFVLSHCGHYPLFLQIAGSILWQSSAVDQLAFQAKFEAQAQDSLRQLWGGLSPAEQTAVTTLAKGDSLPEETIHDLERTGLVERGPANQPRLFSQTFAGLVQKGVFTRSATSRPFPTKAGGNSSPTATPAATTATPNVFFLLLFALIAFVLAAFIASMLFTDPKWRFVAIVFFFYPFLHLIALLADKITGKQFSQSMKEIMDGLWKLLRLK